MEELTEFRLTVCNSAPFVVLGGERKQGVFMTSINRDCQFLYILPKTYNSPASTNRIYA